MTFIILMIRERFRNRPQRAGQVQEGIRWGWNEERRGKDWSCWGWVGEHVSGTSPGPRPCEGSRTAPGNRRFTSRHRPWTPHAVRC